MLIEFTIENFRSIKEIQTFSLIADKESTSKSDNTFEIELKEGSHLRLLKSAVIYGANAAGKSNLIRAFYALYYLVTQSNSFKLNKDIKCYEPFLLNADTQDKPVKFEMIFIGKDQYKYCYRVEYNKNQIVSEKLDYFLKEQTLNLFQLDTSQKDFNEIVFDKALKKENLKINKNRLALSKFEDEYHEKIRNAYLYFDEMEIWNAFDKIKVRILCDKIAEEMLKPENKNIVSRLNKLIKIADTKINSIRVKSLSENDFNLPKEIPDEIKRKIMEDNRIQLFAEHDVYQNNAKIDSTEFRFEEESVGTRILFALGGLILEKLDKGGLIVFDELDNSLHPKLSKFLVHLFHNPVSNPHNAQLLFATHEVTLLDRELFRKDQIWFTEKNNLGETELFSVNDFEGVSDDTHFELWYRSGKFGGNPKIKEIEFIYE